MDDFFIDYQATKEIDKDVKFISFFSGGKDSMLALSIASEHALPISLINCCEMGSPMYHNHDRNIIALQSEAIGVPVDYVEGHWKKHESLKEKCLFYKELGATHAVFGDISDIKNAKRKINLCQSVGLIPYMPLWNMDVNSIRDLLKKYKIKTILTTVRPILNGYVGAILDDRLIDCFEKMGINPLGEKGEYHSTVVDASIFKLKFEPQVLGFKTLNDKFGEKQVVDLYLKKLDN